MFSLHKRQVTLKRNVDGKLTVFILFMFFLLSTLVAGVEWKFSRFTSTLFFDWKTNWHRQQLGKFFFCLIFYTIKKLSISCRPRNRFVSNYVPRSAASSKVMSYGSSFSVRCASCSCLSLFGSDCCRNTPRMVMYRASRAESRPTWKRCNLFNAEREPSNRSSSVNYHNLFINYHFACCSHDWFLSIYFVLDRPPLIFISGGASSASGREMIFFSSFLFFADKTKTWNMSITR